MKTNKIVFGEGNVSKEYQKPELVGLNEMLESEAAGCGTGSSPGLDCVPGSLPTGFCLLGSLYV